MRQNRQYILQFDANQMKVDRIFTTGKYAKIVDFYDTPWRGGVVFVPVTPQIYPFSGPPTNESSRGWRTMEKWGVDVARRRQTGYESPLFRGHPG